MTKQRDDAARSDAHGLTAGAEVAGVTLVRLVASDDFCSIWRTGPVADVKASCCIRLIPAVNTASEKMRDRFSSEMSFWLEQDGGAFVDVYDCGRDAGFYYALMRYMEEGSLAAQTEQSSHIRDHLVDFALLFADALRAVHQATGAHGNLKPTNVFPEGGDNVRLSDFMLNLWADQMHAGMHPLSDHFQHPYRAPEQRKDPQNYDTRSDLYSYGLILLQVLTGSVPFLAGQSPQEVEADWPRQIRRVLRRCLDADPRMRFSDAEELYNQLCIATGRSVQSRADVIDTAVLQHTQDDATALSADTLRVEEAMDLVHEGHLKAAIDLVEGLPPETPGLGALLDEIEQRDAASGELAREAVELAASGDVDAAIDAIEEAERLRGDSTFVTRVRSEIASHTRPRKEAPEEEAQEAAQTAPEEAGSQTLQRVRTALEADNFKTARPLVEKLLRADPESPEHLQVARQFRRRRVRQAFRESIRSARQAYLNGNHSESAQHWLEAARWLRPGPRRERLRRVATAAAEGALRLNVDDLAAMADAESDKAKRPSSEGPALSPEVQSKLNELAQQANLQERRRLRIVLIVLFAALGLLVGGGAALLLYLFG